MKGYEAEFSKHQELSQRYSKFERKASDCDSDTLAEKHQNIKSKSEKRDKEKMSTQHLDNIIKGFLYIFSLKHKAKVSCI